MTITRTPLPATYDALSRLRPIRPIQDDADLNEATWLLVRLKSAEPRTRDQTDYMNVLDAVMKQYEDAQPPFDTSSLTIVDILENLMDCHDMSPSDLGRVLGDRTMGQKVLSGQRGLSKANIIKLARHFHVSPALFLELEAGKKAMPRKKRAPARSTNARPAVRQRISPKR